MKGSDDGEKDQGQVDKLCVALIEEYLAEVASTCLTITSQPDSQAKDTLLRRFAEVQGILKIVLTRITN